MEKLIKGHAKVYDIRELLMHAERVEYNKARDIKGAGGLYDLACEIGFDNHEHTDMLTRELWKRVDKECTRYE